MGITGPDHHRCSVDPRAIGSWAPCGRTRPSVLYHGWTRIGTDPSPKIDECMRYDPIVLFW